MCADLWRSLDLEPVAGPWGVQHHAGGSARVRQLGEVEIALDDAWTRELPRSHRALAWTLALPYAQRAGYRFR